MGAREGCIVRGTREMSPFMRSDVPLGALSGLAKINVSLVGVDIFRNSSNAVLV